MIACVSPSNDCYEETINTLKYAQRAQKIKKKVVSNNRQFQVHVAQYKSIIQNLKGQINSLKQQLRNKESTQNPQNLGFQSNVVQDFSSIFADLSKIDDKQISKLTEAAGVNIDLSGNVDGGGDQVEEQLQSLSQNLLQNLEQALQIKSSLDEINKLKSQNQEQLKKLEIELLAQQMGKDDGGRSIKIQEIRAAMDENQEYFQKLRENLKQNQKQKDQLLNTIKQLKESSKMGQKQLFESIRRLKREKESLASENQQIKQKIYNESKIQQEKDKKIQKMSKQLQQLKKMLYQKDVNLYSQSSFSPSQNNPSRQKFSGSLTIQPHSKTLYSKREQRNLNNRNLLGHHQASSSVFLSKRLSSTLNNFKFNTPSNKSTSISNQYKKLYFGHSRFDRKSSAKSNDFTINNKAENSDITNFQKFKPLIVDPPSAVLFNNKSPQDSDLNRSFTSNLNSQSPSIPIASPKSVVLLNRDSKKYPAAQNQQIKDLKSSKHGEISPHYVPSKIVTPNTSKDVLTNLKKKRNQKCQTTNKSSSQEVVNYNKERKIPMTSPYLNVLKNNSNSNGYSKNQNSLVKKKANNIDEIAHRIEKSKNERVSIQTAQQAIESHIMKPKQSVQSHFIKKKSQQPQNLQKSSRYLQNNNNKKHLTSEQILSMDTGKTNIAQNSQKVQNFFVPQICQKVGLKRVPVLVQDQTINAMINRTPIMVKNQYNSRSTQRKTNREFSEALKNNFMYSKTPVKFRPPSQIVLLEHNYHYQIKNGGARGVGGGGGPSTSSTVANKVNQSSSQSSITSAAAISLGNYQFIKPLNSINLPYNLSASALHNHSSTVRNKNSNNFQNINRQNRGSVKIQKNFETSVDNNSIITNNNFSSLNTKSQESLNKYEKLQERRFQPSSSTNSNNPYSNQLASNFSAFSRVGYPQLERFQLQESRLSRDYYSPSSASQFASNNNSGSIHNNNNINNNNSSNNNNNGNNNSSNNNNNSNMISKNSNRSITGMSSIQQQSPSAKPNTPPTNMKKNSHGTDFFDGKSFNFRYNKQSISKPQNNNNINNHIGFNNNNNQYVHNLSPIQRNNNDINSIFNNNDNYISRQKTQQTDVSQNFAVISPLEKLRDASGLSSVDNRYSQKVVVAGENNINGLNQIQTANMMRMMNRPMYLGHSSADKGNRKAKFGGYSQRPKAVSTSSSSNSQNNSRILQKYINSYSNQGMIAGSSVGSNNNNNNHSNNNNNNNNISSATKM